MKKALALLCLVFAVCACGKKDTPPSFNGCLLKETNFGVVKHEYLYDEQNRLIEIKRSTTPALLMAENYKLEYDEKGNPVKYSRYGFDGELIDYYTYEYNTSNQLVKRNIFNWFGGRITYLHSHHFEYSPVGQLQKVNYDRYSSEYAYLDGNKIKVTSNNGLYPTAEIELDDKKNPFYQLSPSLTMILDDFQSLFLPEVSTPHNITLLIIRDNSGEPSTNDGWAYTKAFEYNAEGLPAKAHITYLASGQGVMELCYTCTK